MIKTIRIKIKRIEFDFDEQHHVRYRASIGRHSAGGPTPKAATRTLLRDIVRDPRIARLDD